MASSTPALRIDRRLVSRVLGAGVAFFVVVNLAWETLSRWMGWVPDTKAFYLFDLDAEKNIATAFAALLLLVAGVLLAVVAGQQRERGGTHVVGWAFLSFGLHFMAIDELVSLHERLVFPMRVWLGGEDLGILYFAWVVPGAVVVLLIALAYVRFFRDLPRATKSAFVWAATVFLVGAMGMELIGGRHAEMWGTLGLRYQLIVTLEEGLEMTGVVIAIDALLAYMGSEYGSLRVAFVKDASSS